VNAGKRSVPPARIVALVRAKTSSASARLLGRKNNENHSSMSAPEGKKSKEARKNDPLVLQRARRFVKRGPDAYVVKRETYQI
jgi:hypothetical protein